ncbi:MAG TPA: NrfD/PsrC family molybdoenzyme membrane anchor subunit [Desulfuromonadaceae bacterium]
MELTVTGANAITSPTLSAWNWELALYLFLGGMAGGVAVMSSILRLRKNGTMAEGEPARFTAPLLIPVILALGVFFVFLDLERKINVFWLYLTFRPLSPMSWGSWSLLTFFPVSALNALSVLPDEYLEKLGFAPLKRFARSLRPHTRPLAVLNFAVGIFVATYTGVLLSAFVARPLWNSAILPMLFLASALTAGAACMIILARQAKVKLFFLKLNVWILAAELVIMPLFTIGQLTAHAHALMPDFSFIYDYLLYGLAIILSLGILKGREEEHPLPATVSRRMLLCACLVLLGGLILRFTMVYEGQLSRLI